MNGGYIIWDANKQNTYMQVWPVRSNFGFDLSVSKQDSPDPVGLENTLELIPSPLQIMVPRTRPQ